MSKLNSLSGGGGRVIGKLTSFVKFVVKKLIQTEAECYYTNIMNQALSNVIYLNSTSCSSGQACSVYLYNQYYFGYAACVYPVSYFSMDTFIENLDSSSFSYTYQSSFEVDLTISEATTFYNVISIS